MDGFELLKQELLSLTGISVPESQYNALHRYADLLAEWNQKINLTAIKAPVQIRRKHFLDSLSCLLVIKDRPAVKLIDVGTGAGFPGLALKIMRPDMQLTLVESVAKKTNFLSLVVQELGLKHVQVITERVETIGKDPAHREQYDWAVARAVAGLPVLTEYLLPLTRVGGNMLAQKGENAQQELQESGDAISTLGGKAKKPLTVHLPGISKNRYLVVIEKINPTPAKFPRRVGIPAKRPL